MRRLQPRPKQRRMVEIPADLREALQEVASLLEDAKNDPDVDLDFDDAIQVGRILCGGRYARKPSRFEFTYYPSGLNGRWHLDLTQFDIEDIADGRQTALLLYCCTNPNCGEKFRKSDDHCECDYVDDPWYGTFTFPIAVEKLAHWHIQGIDETSTKDDVVALLGPPRKAGGGEKVPSLGYIRPWINYKTDDCQVTLSFRKDRVYEVTFLERDWEPGQDWKPGP